MGELTWSDDYSVHIRSIDNEHKLLLEMVNDVERAMQTQGTVGTQLIVAALAQLSVHIRRHFESEERFLLFNNYPEFDRHQEEHGELLKQLERFEEYVRTTAGQLNQNMLLFLKDWLVRHIILHDCKYGSFYKGQELASPYT